MPVAQSPGTSQAAAVVHDDSTEQALSLGKPSNESSNPALSAALPSPSATAQVIGPNPAAPAAAPLPAAATHAQGSGMQLPLSDAAPVQSAAATHPQGSSMQPPLSGPSVAEGSRVGTVSPVSEQATAEQVTAQRQQQIGAEQSVSGLPGAAVSSTTLPQGNSGYRLAQVQIPPPFEPYFTSSNTELHLQSAVAGPSSPQQLEYQQDSAAATLYQDPARTDETLEQSRTDTLVQVSLLQHAGHLP